MKKNLLLATSLLATISLVACKDKEKEEEKTETHPLMQCSAVKDSDLKDGCVKCKMNDKTDVLVCGICSAEDANSDSPNNVKRQCSAAVPGAKEYAQTLVCADIVKDKFFYVEYKNTVCTDTEACNKEKGICEPVNDPGNVPGRECADKTYSCTDAKTLHTHFNSDACTETDFDIDCSDLGGCDAEHKNCKNTNGICEDDERAISSVCDERDVLYKHADIACKNASTDQVSCLMFKMRVDEEDDSLTDTVIVVGTCDADSDEGVARCVPDKKTACPEKPTKKEACIGGDRWEYYTYVNCGMPEKAEEPGNCKDTDTDDIE